MKKGEFYKVYEDPLTKTKLEGIAKIITIVKGGTYLKLGYYECYVRFGGLGESKVYRKIDKRDLVK